MDVVGGILKKSNLVYKKYRFDETRLEKYVFERHYLMVCQTKEWISFSLQRRNRPRVIINEVLSRERIDDIIDITNRAIGIIERENKCFIL